MPEIGDAVEKHRRNAVDTRRLYAMERKFLQRNTPRLGIFELRWLALKVWTYEKLPAEQFPKIIAGEGIFYLGVWTSYCDTALRPMKIVLAAHHRKIPVLLHELTHAMGHWNHDCAFVERYFQLLSRYGGYTHEELVINAAWFGIKV